MDMKYLVNIINNKIIIDKLDNETNENTNQNIIKSNNTNNLNLEEIKILYLKKFNNKYNKNNIETDIDNNIDNDNKNSERDYICKICNAIFSNGQGLGGHMSRKHPNQSVKYKFKKETREKRNLKREIVYEAKRRILKKYKEDYDNLIETHEGRKIIKMICKDNKNEYYRIKKQIKKK